MPGEVNYYTRVKKFFITTYKNTRTIAFNLGRILTWLVELKNGKLLDAYIHTYTCVYIYIIDGSNYRKTTTAYRYTFHNRNRVWHKSVMLRLWRLKTIQMIQQKLLVDHSYVPALAGQLRGFVYYMRTQNFLWCWCVTALIWCVFFIINIVVQ